MLSKQIQFVLEFSFEGLLLCFMFRFQYENFFWLLLCIPLMILLYVLFDRKRRADFLKYFTPQNLKKVLQMPLNSLVLKTPWLLILGVVLLIFGMANLQSGKYTSGQAGGAGRDVLFVLDVSKSMNAQDVKPNRMDASKLLISKMVKKASHDRIGLVTFAGNATVVSPLSADYLTLLDELQKVKPGMAAVQGTSIASALEMGVRSFKNNQNQNKALVLITDGEDHEKGINSEVKKLKSEGVQIFTIGVGSEQGASFVDPETGQLQVDKNGQQVVSKTNPEVIKSIADQADGDYIFMRSISQASSDLVSGLATLGTNSYTESNFKQSHSYYLIFVILGMLCVLLETLVSYRILAPRAALAGVLLIVTSTAQAQSADEMPREVQLKLYKAGEQVKQKKYTEAETLYKEVLKENPKNFIANYNLATSQYQQKSAAGARQAYEASLQNTLDPNQKAQILYNIGNTYMLEKNWDSAIESYKKSLLINPNDENARYNLAYAQKMKKNDDQKKKKDKKDDKKDDQKKKNKDKEKDKEKEQKPKPQPKPKMSKQEAEQALQQLRKKSRDFKKGDTIEGRPTNFKEKDW